MIAPAIKKNTEPLLKDFVKKFIGVFIKSGNKESIRRLVFQLIKNLKTPHQQKINPLSYLQECLQKLKPGFNFVRIMRGGKLFMIPVAITDNHALFKAAFWLKKAAIVANKNDKPFAENIAKEIFATFNNTGMAIDSLSAHIDLAMDNRPFMFFVRKKKIFEFKSKRRAIGRTLNTYKRILKQNKPRYDFFPNYSRYIRQKIKKKHVIRQSLLQLSTASRLRVFRKGHRSSSKEKSARYEKYLKKSRMLGKTPLGPDGFFRRQERASAKRLLRFLKQKKKKQKSGSIWFLYTK